MARTKGGPFRCDVAPRRTEERRLRVPGRRVGDDAPGTVEGTAPEEVKRQAVVVSEQ